MVTALYAGILAILFIALGVNVIRKRLQNAIGIGDGDNHPLQKAIRVHGNFAEHVPFALLLIGFVEFNAITPFEPTPIYLHFMGITLVLSRIAHAYGLSKTSVASVGRSIGVIGTYSVMMAAAILLIGQYVIIQIRPRFQPVISYHPN